MQQIETNQETHRKNIYRSNDYTYKIIKKGEYDQLVKGQFDMKKDRGDLENDRDKYKKLYENEEKLNKILS